MAKTADDPAKTKFLKVQIFLDDSVVTVQPLLFELPFFCFINRRLAYDRVKKKCKEIVLERPWEFLQNSSTPFFVFVSLFSLNVVATSGFSVTGNRADC